jgi:uncharacterized membrane protein YoaK (UPF0700 family)
VKSPLRFATLLCAGGGLLDSFTWVAHGHVFANAQTGNIILFGVFAAQDDWPQALRHIPPMLAFFPGVFVAQWLRKRSFADDPPRATAVCLGIEIAILTAVGCLSFAFPHIAVVFAIAFAAAMQNSGFDHVGKWSYASVVITGNLRSLGDAWFSHMFLPRKSDASDQARTLAIVCASFTCGAIAGAALTVSFGKLAIVFPIILLSLALLSCIWDARDGAETGPPSSNPSNLLLPQTGEREAPRPPAGEGLG